VEGWRGFDEKVQGLVKVRSLPLLAE
jgi:hypothetical protein